ncbi:ras-related GTP-binding protein A-like protein [Sporodiniella umbellata]|nr:ras-related GTP-binding protein A-like protein [Sporodiniella umbellata]
MKENKILLMGKSGVGKTSMQSIIFHNSTAKDTKDLEPTILWNNETNVRFIGNISMTLWDFSGQGSAFSEYFTIHQRLIFKSVCILVYVFDSISTDLDIHYYQASLELILKYSPHAKVFCFMHKSDLIPDNKRQQMYDQQSLELCVRSEPITIQSFQTSIWDESLYAAWSKVIDCLLPNIHRLQLDLDQLCNLCDADEIVLFEKTTLLVIAHSTSLYHPDPHRFEKISSIIKQFNLYTR